MAAAAALVATELLGLLASRVFEVVLRVDPDFAAGPTEYLNVGYHALTPFAILWILGAAAIAALAALRPFIWPRTVAIRRRLSALEESLDPSVPAALTLMLGVGGLILLYWSFSTVYVALERLALDPQPGSLDLSVLSSAARPLHRAHFLYSAVLSFLLGLAVWRWSPHLERRSADPKRLRTVKWATAAVAFLIVALETAPRRIIWDDFEVVSFENRQASVISTSSRELLLYARQAGEQRYFRVPVDAAALERRVDVRQLFDTQRPKPN